MRALPYPGYSWSFTQHAIGLEPKTLYSFLECASVFEGHDTRGLKDKITPLMVELGILTPNERDGQNDAWRDYQQLLAELGLIYSTKLSRVLIITEIGKMFLAGEVGFSELVGIQSLRYQYPNGQKSIIQSRQKTVLEEKGINYPATLVELQVNERVLLKPGTLILRVLIELISNGEENYVSVDECQAFIVPCKDNTEWHLATDEIKNHRKANNNVSQINRHCRRNIQDWLKFLQHSNYFELSSSSELSLTEYAISNIGKLIKFCEIQENSEFWVPSEYSRAGFMSWFEYFGSIPFNAQSLLAEERELTTEYVEENFVRGVVEETEQFSNLSGSFNLNLEEVDIQSLERNPDFQFRGDIKALASRVIAGAQKRHAKTILHDSIIKELVEQFRSQGAIVQEDKNSIDLFSTWPSGESAIFEVKTVTARSFQSRLRSAIGQVKEYGYRKEKSGDSKSDQVIVVNSELPKDAWQREFLNNYLEIGLICKTKRGQSYYAPENSMTCKWWAP